MHVYVLYTNNLQHRLATRRSSPAAVSSWGTSLADIFNGAPGSLVGTA